ncbi:hypothetical protein LTR56_016196 [Elasticomyces elasticus]|nr:hypothetical protein LTR56_016196 [Elasticomyces elasticus]KAK3642155.1 hypothetical protein LTR22_016276 [Elasticomyces elasticus]KAK4914203.1 hypothetical protein LTR49_017556 [Elasticomyces elasticus]KAK5762564.1 hypothetical protein LTS12_007355 [Elasticomyces elasticus]
MSAQDDGARDSRIYFRQTHHEFQPLGSGGYGIACLAAKKNANDQQAQISGVRALPPSRQVDPARLIVVKYYKQNDDPDESDESKDLSNEIAIMKTFGKKYHGVVELLNSYVAGDVQWMTMPLLRGGTLHDFIGTSANKAPVSFVWHVAHSIVGSLLFMYFGITSVDASGNTVTEPRWSPITHNDIHNNNIYLGLAPAAAEYKHSNFPLVVLADFGQSKSHPDYAEFVDSAKDDVVTLGTHVIKKLSDAIDGAQSQELEDWMDKCGDILGRDEEFNVSTKEFLLDLLKTAATERRKGDQYMPQTVLDEMATVPRLIDASAVEEE